MTRDEQRALLQRAKTIAVVGHSDNPARTSYQIAQALRRFGYTVYAVNPTVSEIDGQPAYATLRDVPAPIDIVNVFRRSEYLLDVVQEAIAVKSGAIWAQLGVSDPAALSAAQEAGLPIVMDNCIKVTYNMLMP